MKYRGFETTLLAANLFEPSLVVYINTIPHTLVRRTATGSSVGSAAWVGLAALKPPTDFCRGGLDTFGAQGLPISLGNGL